MIPLHRLTNRFGDQTAVKYFSFDIPARQIVGLPGPNGAVFESLSGLEHLEMIAAFHARAGVHRDDIFQCDSRSRNPGRPEGFVETTVHKSFDY